MNPRKIILTLPYRAYRTPIATLDTRLSRRLREDAPSVLVLERVLGSYDRAAGRLMGDEALAAQGVQRIHRADKLAEAAGLEREAAERRATAQRVADEGAERAAAQEEQAEQRLAEGLDDAEATERRDKQAAAQRARSTAAQRKQAADAKAGQRRQGVRRTVEQTESVTKARTTAAQRRAKATLDEAADERASARTKRTQAEQLESLAETKRNARTS